MQTKPAPIARTLVFLCIGVLGGLVTLPYEWSGAAFFGSGLFAGPGLAILLGVHLWRQPQRTSGQITAVCLSPLIAGTAYILAILVIGIIIGILCGNFMWVLQMQAPLSDWLLSIAVCLLLAVIFALGGVVAGGFIALCLSPLMPTGTRRWLLGTGAVNGLLLQPCMLAGAWYISRHPDLAEWYMSAPGFDPLPPPPEWTHSLMYFVLKPQIGPFLPIAFGLFAAVLGWLLPVPVQGNADAD